MIPKFPVLKKLTIKDKKEIEAFVRRYPPYSDYNFVSLWSYNTKENITISMLNGNLVVKFIDYFGDKHFYSFLGNKQVEKTVKTLLSYAKANNINKELILIPDINIEAKNGLSKQFVVEEDQDNFDYILSTHRTGKLNGNKYSTKRNFINRFVKNYPKTITSIFDIRDPKMQKQVEKLFVVWEQKTNKIREQTKNEFKAIRRLFDSAAHFKLISIGIFVTNKMIAFSINEMVHDNYAIIHFEKADVSYVGIFQYLKQQTAKHLNELGCKYINYEQDLGIPGLRKAKESWQPIKYLKKFKIYKKN